MANDPFFDEGANLLDEADLLEEGEFLDDDDGGFEDEATAVFQADVHGSHPDDWSSEGALGDDAGEYEDEATTVLMEDDPAYAPFVPPEGNAPRPSRAQAAVVPQPARPQAAPQPARSYAAPQRPQVQRPQAQRPQAPAHHGGPPRAGLHHGTPGVAEVAAPRVDDEMAEEATVVTDIHTFQQQQQQQAAGYPPGASGNWQAGAPAPNQWQGGAPAQQPQAQPQGQWQGQQRVRPHTGQQPGVIAVPRAQPEQRGMGGVQIALLVLVLLAFIGVAGLGIRFFLMPGAPEVVEGSVAIMTTPPGATIEIDGEAWAEVTPAVVGGLEVGRDYAITLSLEGHEPIRDSVTLESADAVQKSWELDALTGTISVASQPPGAVITIDGDEQGEAPATLDDLDMSRSYTVTAALDGYEPVTRTVRWDAEGPREQNIAITLTPIVEDEPEDVEAPEDETEEPAVAAAAPSTTRSATSSQTARPSASTPSRPSTTRPSTTRPSGTRPSGTASAPTGTRPSGSRPSGTRPSGERPSGDRPSATATPPSGSRPSGSRPSGSRPSGSRPSGERPSGTAPSQPTATAGDGYISVQAVPFGQVWVNNRMVASETPLMNHPLPAGVHQVKVYFTPIRQFSEERTVRVEPGSSRTLTFHAPR